MPTHVQVVPCQEKQVISKFVKKVPCPQAKPKKKQKREMPCPGSERRKSQGRVEGTTCPEMECRKPPKPCQNVVPCEKRQVEKPSKCVRKIVPCSAGEQRSPPRGCPKCENNRIEKLECEVYKLRREIECMKLDRKAAEKAVGRAIIRGARALGGKYKPIVPDSIEKLLDSCDSDASSQSTSPSITYCSTRNTPGPTVTRFCQNKPARRQEFDYCE